VGGPIWYKLIILDRNPARPHQKEPFAMVTDAKDLLTIPQAAEALDKAPVTIRKWLRARKLAHYRIGGEIRISPDDVAAVIAAGRRPALA
jgi:excisionase family DNA binding protein